MVEIELAATSTTSASPTPLLVSTGDSEEEDNAESNLSSKEIEMKVLLNDVSGEAHRGEILAVLGPSGSGKSTLIDALANRIFKGSLNGMITLSGEQLDSSLLRAISAYVMQDHLLFPMLTVEETLTFAAELRLPQILSKFEKKKRVHDLIDQLDHQTAVQTIIGDEKHRGGWWRTLARLDSTSAFKVVKVLQSIAQTGSMLIMSIHQPSFQILGLLDKLLFLSHGQVVYSGSPSNLPFFMENLGQPIPADQNPSDAILDLICDLEYSRDGIDSMAQFNQIWQQQYMGRGIGSEVKQSTAKQSLNLKQAFSQSLDLKQAFSSIISRDKLAISESVLLPCSRGQHVNVASPRAIPRLNVSVCNPSTCNTCRPLEAFLP
ncbi:ABC transporter G family member 20-like [Coffea eugenioides]|uniref:ABC transporter G family member 20-like n=1 Tax=Coffea eugenioides TaxID=49369 RepID=UPI000F608193|nr:ABC transporter G family member 20-like [Coffea eugenioides]